MKLTHQTKINFNEKWNIIKIWRKRISPKNERKALILDLGQPVSDLKQVLSMKEIQLMFFRFSTLLSMIETYFNC